MLRRKTRPTLPDAEITLRSVDLFAGCGGMTLGLEQVASELGLALKPALAMDSDKDILDIYASNFKSAKTVVGDVASAFDGAIGSRWTASERGLRGIVGPCDLLIGGPPCQGHSDLNNHTRRRDPKNRLYLSMARAADVLTPKVVIIENVAPVEWDRSGVVDETTTALQKLGYEVAGRVLNLSTLGVPQRRRRYLLLASAVSAITPEKIFAQLEDEHRSHPTRSVRWAIGDLEARSSTDVFETSGRTSEDNQKRIAYLMRKGALDLPNELRPPCHRNGEHSYKSMYGRLPWDEPAQTITTGFGSMGQGRYVHPSQPRTITPHEAARLQTFPDWFDFGSETRRGTLAKAIGNAVPPFLMLELGRLVLPALASDLEKSAEIG
jgi:DNA (cytosine-5)-methyltransferase 1